MKSRSPSRATRVLTLAALGCIISPFMAGSVALSQPFPSFMLDSSIVRGPTLADEVAGTAVAFGPDTGLVVWVEDYVLRGVRVSSTGALLDTVPIEVSGPDIDAEQYSRPSVTWGAGQFFVAWLGGSEAMCASVGTDGNVTRRSILQETVNTSSNSRAASGFDGTNFIVAWAGSLGGGPYTAFFCRVSPQGAVLDSPPRLVAPRGAVEQYDIAVCFHEDRYLTVWHDWDTSGMWGSFILPDGSVPDSVGFPVRTGKEVDFPHLTHDSRNFVVAWQETGDRTMLARVTDDGQVLDTAGVVLDSFSPWQNDVFSTGDTTLVVFSSDSLSSLDSTRVRAMRVDTALARLDSVPVVLSGPSEGSSEDVAPNDPAIALCGDDYIVAWVQPVPPDSESDPRIAWYRRLSRQGQLVDSTPVVASYGSNSQTYPDVASDGTNFLAVWADTRRDSTGRRSVAYHGMRFSADGVLLDPQPIQIGDGASIARHPTLAWGGGCYLVLWPFGFGFSAARVAPDGSLLDSVPFAIEDPDMPERYPDVAYGDSVFLAVWSTQAADDIHGVRITPSGLVLDTMPLLLQVDASYRSAYPQVAFDGENLLVARNDSRPLPRRLRGVRVNTSGQILDTADIDMDSVTTTSATPKLTFGGSVYLVTNSRYGNSRRVTPEGVVLDPVPSTYHSYAQSVFDSTNFMLLCRRDSSDELGAMRITPDGRLLDSTPFLLVTAEGAQTSAQCAAMAANASGRVGLVSRCFEQPPYLTYRIRAAAFPAVLGIGAGHEDARVAQFRALPNPASRMVSLSFGLRQAGPVQVSAFDAAGRRCAVVHSGRMPAGTHSLAFDTGRLANGVYFLRFEAGADARSARMVVSH